MNALVISRVVGQASDGEAAIRIAQSVKPDVIVMDVVMPIKNGIDACREISETLPSARVLMLTAASEEDAVTEAVAAGASGYLQKYSGKDELLRAVRRVAEGELSIPADSIRRVFSGIRTAAQRSANQLSRLTEREKQILYLFAQGRTYAQIAAARGNQPVTIRNAIYGIQEQAGDGYEAGASGLGRAKRLAG